MNITNFFNFEYPRFLFLSPFLKFLVNIVISLPPQVFQKARRVPNTILSRLMVMLRNLMNMFRPIIMAVRMSGRSRYRRMNRRRYTTNVLHRQRIILAGFQVFVEYGEYLRIQYLKSSNPIYHPF